MNKVKLRFYTEDDLQFLHELLSDESTKKYFPFMYTTCMEQSKLRLLTRLTDQDWGNYDRVVIVDRKSKKPVGEISGRIAREDSLRTMELAIIIHPNYRGQGFAKAGTLEYMKYITKRKKDITKFRLEISDSNTASLSVAKKLEFNFASSKNENMQYWEKEVP